MTPSRFPMSTDAGVNLLGAIVLIWGDSILDFLEEAQDDIETGEPDGETFEENARKADIEDAIMEKILTAGELLIRLTPYYKSE